MKQQQPTKEQLKKFWKWCGFYTKDINTHPESREYWVIYAPNNQAICSGFDKKDFTNFMPKIDLNNLFKYAVPKLEKKYLYDYIHFGQDSSVPSCFHVQITYGSKLLAEAHTENNTPELALFWAIWEVIHG